ncbi:hypothetical protein KXX55_003084 [Aspergillus fumigatus]|nr:hypothetical protein KXX55_003084 [Aspergillus fumigatus]
MAKPVSIHTHRGSQASCNLNADESTPPEQHKFPLTPPPTAERQAYDIVVCVCFENIQLHPQRFWSSGLTLANYVNDKVRWDYDPESEQLQIRMPSPVHDFFVASVAGEISKQLQTIIDEGGPASECSANYEWRIFTDSSAGEEFDVLEVDQVVEAEVFRTQDGRPANKGRRLSLNLSDFGPDELSDGYERKELSISYGTLVNLLNRTERIHQARESAPGLRGIESKQPIRKQKLRSSSPAEQLRSDDEAKRRRQEAQAEERTAASDKDYEPPSSRRRGAGKP